MSCGLFFLKQTTAYDLRISDWSSDVCSADLLATGRTDQALTAYEQRGHAHASETREQARAELVDSWDRARTEAPDATRIILTHTNDEVQELNARSDERRVGQEGRSPV